MLSNTDPNNSDTLQNHQPSNNGRWEEKKHTIAAWTARKHNAKQEYYK